MRTTLNLDEDILRIARQIAADQGISLGKVVSDLARRGLARNRMESRDGLPVFSVSEAAPTFTGEDVASAEEDE
ncbi:MAG: antitoxin [bacterium]